MIELIKNCAKSVYNELGGNHSETVMEAAMAVELSLRGLSGPSTVTRQVPVPLKYKGFTIGVCFLDLLVENIIVEVKTITKLTPKDIQQVRKYLIALDLENGLLINFGPELEIIEVQRNEIKNEQTISAPC